MRRAADLTTPAFSDPAIAPLSSAKLVLALAAAACAALALAVLL